MNFAEPKSIFKTIFIIVCFLMSSKTLSQSSFAETEKAYLQAKNNDNGRLLLAAKYAQQLLYNDRPHEAMQLIDKNIEIAKKNKDGQYAAYLNSIAAINSRILGKNEKALQYLAQAKKYLPATKDIATLGYVAYCEGWLQVRNGQETQAVQNFHKAIQYFDKVPETELTISRKTKIYNELSSIYADWKMYELQEKYTRLTLKAAEKRNNPSDVFEALIPMGLLYETKFKNNNSVINYRNEAEKYFLQALEIYTKNKDKMSAPSDLAYAHIKLAELYSNNYPDSYKTKAEHHAKEAIDAAKISGQINFEASAYTILADISKNNGSNSLTKDYLLMALNAMKQETVVNNSTILNLHKKLSAAYEYEKDFANALSHYQKYVNIYEKIYDTEKIEQSRLLEASFEKKLQQQKLIQLSLEAEKKEQELALMKVSEQKHTQEMENMSLNEKNHLQKIRVMFLEAEKKEQDLKLSRTKAEQNAVELKSSQQALLYKSKINNYYILLAGAFFLSALILFYAFWQRSQKLKQREILHLSDISQMKQKNKISNLTSMLEGQETERARLARDLHDGLGGLLSRTKMELSMISQNSVTEIQENKIAGSMEKIDLAVEELRRIAHNLMPEILLKYGLKEALQEYASRMSTQNLEVSCEFINFNTHLTEERQVLIYRIIQELVNNAVKHAEAKQIFIQISEDNNLVSVTLEDDGKGFDTQKINAKKSAGIQNIKSRLAFLKGEMHLNSTIGIGTTVEITFPTHPENT